MAGSAQFGASYEQVHRKGAGESIDALISPSGERAPELMDLPHATGLRDMDARARPRLRLQRLEPLNSKKVGLLRHAGAGEGDAYIAAGVHQIGGAIATSLRTGR